MHAAGVPGGDPVQLARRVAVEQVTLDHAVDDQRSGARRHTLGIVIGRAQRLRQERVFLKYF